MSIVFLFDENPDVASASSGGAAVGGARSVPDHAAQSERRRRLALATGFRLLRLSGMKLLGAKLRGIFAKFSEALSPSFAKATEGSPRLHPRSKLRGIRRRRINRIAAQGSVAGRGWAGLDGRGF